MSANSHQHAAVRIKTVGYTGSIAGADENRAAHGGVMHIETCACEAERRLNSNGPHEEAGPWYRPHSSVVVTYQAPRGDRIDVCTRCEERLILRHRWPKNSVGEEYCSVSRGAHHGACGLKG